MSKRKTSNSLSNILDCDVVPVTFRISGICSFVKSRWIIHLCLVLIYVSSWFFGSQLQWALMVSVPPAAAKCKQRPLWEEFCKEEAVRAEQSPQLDEGQVQKGHQQHSWQRDSGVNLQLPHPPPSTLLSGNSCSAISHSPLTDTENKAASRSFFLWLNFVFCIIRSCAKMTPNWVEL